MVMANKQRDDQVQALWDTFWQVRRLESAAWLRGIKAFERGEITGDDLAYAAGCSRTKAFKMIRELGTRDDHGKAAWERETETAWR